MCSVHVYLAVCFFTIDICYFDYAITDGQLAMWLGPLGLPCVLQGLISGLLPFEFIAVICSLHACDDNSIKFVIMGSRLMLANKLNGFGIQCCK